MVNLIRIVIIILAVVIISGCQSSGGDTMVNTDPPQNIEVKLKLNSKKIHPDEELVLNVVNNDTEEINFGADYILERFTDGKWLEIFGEEVLVISILYVLAPGKSLEQPVYWVPTEVNGRYVLSFRHPKGETKDVKVAPGNYRISKKIYKALDGVRTNESIIIYAEFEVVPR